MTRLIIASIAALAAAPALAQQSGSFEAGEIVVSDLLGEVTLANEPGPVRVEITRGDDAEAPGATLSEADGVVSIAGETRDLRDDYDCGDRRGVEGYREDRFLFRGDFHAFAEANRVTIVAPETVRVRIEDSLAAFAIDAVGALEVDSTSCGQLSVARVEGDTALDITGVAEVDIGATRGFELEMSGVGDIQVGEVDGPVRVEFSGVGDVSIRNGTADPLTIDLSGVGDVSFGGHAVNPDLSMTGIGEVSINTYEGELRRDRTGIGQIDVN